MALAGLFVDDSAVMAAARWSDPAARGGTTWASAYPILPGRSVAVTAIWADLGASVECRLWFYARQTPRDRSAESLRTRCLLPRAGSLSGAGRAGRHPRMPTSDLQNKDNSHKSIINCPDDSREKTICKTPRMSSHALCLGGESVEEMGCRMLSHRQHADNSAEDISKLHIQVCFLMLAHVYLSLKTDQKQRDRNCA